MGFNSSPAPFDACMWLIWSSPYRGCYLPHKFFGGPLHSKRLQACFSSLFCDLGSGHMELQVCHAAASYPVPIQNILDKIMSCKQVAEWVPSTNLLHETHAFQISRVRPEVQVVPAGQFSLAQPLSATTEEATHSFPKFCAKCQCLTQNTQVSS